MKRQTKISLLTAVALVAGLLYYFFIYAERRNDLLHQQNYRILAKIAENIERKFYSLRKSARNQTDYTTLTGIFERVNVNDQGPVSDAMSENKELLFDEEEISFLFVSDSGKVIRLPVERLMSGLLRKNYFDEYLLFRNDTTVYSTLTMACHVVALEDSPGNKPPIVTMGGSEYLRYAQPVRMGDTSQWLFVGLRDNKAFNTDQYRVSPFIILILVIMFLVFTAGMPFLKLILLGKKEQLDTRDILYISCGTVLGTMLITLLFLDIFDYSFSKKSRIDHNLTTLSDTISGNFIEEIDQLYRQVTHMNRQYLDRDTATERTDYLQNPVPGDTLFYPYFIQASWMDSSGSQMPYKKWSTRSKTTTGIDVSKRYYYSGLKNPHNWWRTGVTKTGGFVLEQIISWNTGEYLTVMGYLIQGSDSTNLESPPYSASITTKLVSVTDPVMPEGYAFAIIDETGKVLYHSDSQRSFHENLFDETQQSGPMKAAVFARHDKSFDIIYQGKPHRAHAAPVAGTTYTIVTMAEMEYYRTANMMTLTAVALMSLLLFALYGLQFFIKRVVTYRKSILDYSIPQFTWLRPDRRMNGFYGKLTFAHAAHIILLALFIALCICLESGDHAIIPLLYLSPSVAVFFSYFRLSPKGWRQSRREDDGLRLAVGVVMLMVLVGSWRLYGISVVCFLLAYLLAASLLYYLILFSIETVSDRLRCYVKNSTLYRWYCERCRYYLFLLTFILILAVVPVSGFYISAYNQEARLTSSYHLLTFARNLEEKEDHYRTLINDRKGMKSKTKKADFMVRSIYGYNGTVVYMPDTEPSDYVGIKKLSDSPKDTKKVLDSIAPLLAQIRPYYNDIALRNNELLFGEASDLSYALFTDDNSNRLTLIHKGLSQDTLSAVSGSVDIYDPFSGKKEIAIPLFISMCMVGLIFLHAIIRFSIQKIFLFRKLESPAIKFEADDLKTLLAENDIFIVGLPLSGRSRMLNDFREKLKGNKITALIDFRTWEPRSRLTMISDIREAEVIILEHLEYNWSVSEFNAIKLAFIGDMLAARRRHQKFIMCSAMHPQHLPDFTSDEGLNLRRFLNMIKTFVKVFYPLRCDKETSSYEDAFYEKQPLALQPREYEARASMTWLHMLKKRVGKLLTIPGNLQGINKSQRMRYDVYTTIHSETMSGQYLKGLRRPLTNYFYQRLGSGSSVNLYEEVILKVQSMANPYYQSLWNFLTIEEKVVVIDIAKDTLVNDRNMRTINILINKGILRFDPESERIFLLNNSFRNFVLTRLTDKEEERLLQEVKGYKTWETFKTPAIMIAITIVLFLFATQQETVDQIIAFVSASAASITLLAKGLSGFLNKRKEPAQS